MRVLPLGFLIASLVACSSAANDRGDAAVGGKAGTLAGSGGAPAAISGSGGRAGSAGNGTGPSAGRGARDAGPSDASQSLDAGPNLDASAGDAGPVMPSGPVQTPGDPGSADVAIEVHADMDVHPISPLIYGTNGAPDIATNHQTVVRSGGNRMTAYNWENNASNAGSDYMFQNDDFLSSSNDPAKPILDGINEANANHAAFIATIPNVDYVSADKSGGGDVRNSGSNYLTTRFKQNKESKGSAFASSPDPNDAFVYQDEFVAFLKAHVGSARVLFSMDNEPDLWSSTHAEVHPKPVTYAELWDRNRRFGSAVKAAWTGVEVLAPVNYGWNGYTSLQNASDANGRDFLEWYLDQAKAAEADGGRVIDYLDLHWYPEAKGGNTRITGTETDAAVVTAREQAPRSLWDSTYDEVSWIHDSLNGPITLVPRMLKKIADHYPGTKLSFTEWNYGGGGHISGAIASADVLGVFGRDGVSLATFWVLNQDESFSYAAFRAYRNFDGQGGAFGDTSIRATSSDVSDVSAYASSQSTAADGVRLVVINRATASKSVSVKLWHGSTFSHFAVYQLVGGTAALGKQSDQPSVAKNAWKLMLPAQSVSVLVPQK